LFGVGASVLGDVKRVARIPRVIGDECAVWRPCQVDDIAVQEDLRGSADQWHHAQPSIRKSAGKPNLRAVVRDADVSHDQLHSGLAAVREIGEDSGSDLPQPYVEGAV